MTISTALFDNPLSCGMPFYAGPREPHPGIPTVERWCQLPIEHEGAHASHDAVQTGALIDAERILLLWQRGLIEHRIYRALLEQAREWLHAHGIPSELHDQQLAQLDIEDAAHERMKSRIRDYDSIVHDERCERCERCGERILDGQERAELGPDYASILDAKVHDSILVHVACMEPGDRIA